MLIQLENGSPVGNAVVDENFRQLFPNTSFPAVLTPDVVEPYGFGVYTFSEKPLAGRYQKAVESEPTCDDDGVWHQSWTLVDMTAHEQQEVDQNQSDLIREDRNQRLSYCDWTQLPDAPVDAASWASYRQQLRDITAQVGFPWDVIWPIAPG